MKHCFFGVRWFNSLRTLAVVFAIASLATAAGQERHGRPKFLEHAIVTPTDDLVVVQANDPRPLDQAIIGLREQYGWIVDYEDPPYDEGDLVDTTDPKWRSAHPNEKGAVGARGADF